MGDVIQDDFGDFDADAPTEEIEDFFLSDKDKWENGEYFGADKP